MTTHWWVGGGSSTNWNAVGPTNWSIIGSGGAGGAAIPVTGDDVIFDGNSGTGGSVWNTVISLNSLVCTGSKNAITGAAAITISGGNLTLPDGVGATYAHTGTFTFTGTSGTQQITTNGKTVPALTFNGAGGTFQLQDAIVGMVASVNATITLTAGTFDAQSFNVSLINFICNSGSTRVLIGTGTWTVRTSGGATTPWNLTTSGLTSSGFTANINWIVDANQTTNRTFAGGGVTTYGTFTISGGNTLGGFNKITGANTFANIACGTLTTPLTLNLVGSTTQTVSNAFTMTANASDYLFICSDTLGTLATISVSSGASTLQYVSLRDIAFTGGGTFTASSSIDNGHNTGITITAPAGGAISVDSNLSMVFDRRTPTGY
jgi:hypothetical protein